MRRLAEHGATEKEISGVSGHKTLKEVARVKGVVDNIERDYANAKEIAKVLAERDPEVRLH
jgi:hypothetical protein